MQKREKETCWVGRVIKGLGIWCRDIDIISSSLHQKAKLRHSPAFWGPPPPLLPLSPSLHADSIPSFLLSIMVNYDPLPRFVYPRLISPLYQSWVWTKSTDPMKCIFLIFLSSMRPVAMDLGCLLNEFELLYTSHLLIIAPQIDCDGAVVCSAWGGERINYFHWGHEGSDPPTYVPCRVFAWSLCLATRSDTHTTLGTSSNCGMRSTSAMKRAYPLKGVAYCVETFLQWILISDSPRVCFLSLLALPPNLYGNELKLHAKDLDLLRVWFAKRHFPRNVNMQWKGRKALSPLKGLRQLWRTKINLQLEILDFRDRTKRLRFETSR